MIPDGAKRCAHCGKVKRLGCFARRGVRDGYQPWCKTCHRLDDVERRRTAAYRAWLLAYLARPEVRARRVACDRARRREGRRGPRDARGRLLAARHSAVARLRRSDDPARRADLRALIALHERELDRIDAASGLPRRWRPLDVAASSERRATC